MAALAARSQRRCPAALVVAAGFVGIGLRTMVWWAGGAVVVIMGRTLRDTPMAWRASFVCLGWQPAIGCALGLILLFLASQALWDKGARSAACAPHSGSGAAVGGRSPGSVLVLSGR